VGRWSLAGLVLAAVAGIMGVIGQHDSGAPGVYVMLNYVAAALPLAAAIAALAVRRLRLPLALAALGTVSYFASLACYDLSVIVDYHIVVLNAPWRFLLFTAGMVLGVIATVILLLALHRAAPWSRRLSGRGAVPVAALWVAVSSWLVWNGVLIAQQYTLEASSSFGTLVSHYYPDVLASLAGLVLTGLVVWYGLGFQDGRLGGWLVFGWALEVSLIFLAFLKAGWDFSGLAVALNWLAAIGMLIVAALVIALLGGRATKSSPS
jgi:hypothetical protein